MTSEIRPSGIASLVGASVARNRDGAIVQVPLSKTETKPRESKAETEAAKPRFNTVVTTSVSAVKEATQSVQAISGMRNRDQAEQEVSAALKEASKVSVENVEQASSLAQDLARRISSQPELSLNAAKKTPLEQLAHKLTNIFSK